MIVTAADIRVLLGIESTISEDELGVLTLCHGWVEGLVKRWLKYDPEYKTHTEIHPRRNDLNAGQGIGVWDATSDGSKGVFERRGVARWHEYLMLDHIPLRAVSSVYEDYDARHGTQGGAFGASSLLTVGDEYVPVWDMTDSDGNSVGRTGMIQRYGSSWPSDPGTVKVTYTAGYTSKELSGYDSVINASPIRMAVVQEVGTNFRRWWMRRKSSRLGHIPGVLKSEKLGDYSYSLGGMEGSAVQELGFAADLTSGTKQILQPFRHMGQLML